MTKLGDALAKSEKARKKACQSVQELGNALRDSKLAHALMIDKLRALEVTCVWRVENVGEKLKLFQKNSFSLYGNSNVNSSTNCQLNLSGCPGGPAPAASASGEQQGSSEEEERLADSADFNVLHGAFNGSGGVSCVWMALTINVKTNELSVSLFKREVYKPVILSSSSASAGTKSKGKKRKSTQPAVQQQQQHGSTRTRMWT